MMRTLGSSLLPVMGGASWALTPLKPAPKPVVPPKSASHSRGAHSSRDVNPCRSSSRLDTLKQCGNGP